MNSYVAAIIPVYNEGERILKTLKGLMSVDLIQEIIVVDDGSTDNTSEVLRGFSNVRLIKHEKNRGKATALKTGLKAASEGADIIVFLDGDLEESSQEAEKLIQPLLRGEAEVTIAQFPSPKKKVGFGLVKGLIYLGQKIYTGKSIRSALSGQRAFKREILNHIKIPHNGYGIELSMTIDLLRQGVAIKEVPVEMKHNETGRDLRGFLHRGRQFIHIFKVILMKGFHE